MQPDPTTQLKKYFSGECSREEQQLIEQLLLTEDNAAFSAYLQAEWEALPNNVIPDQTLAAERYARLSKKMRTKPDRRIWYWAAAIALLFIIPVKFLFTGTQWETITTGTGEHKDILLADGSHVWLNCASSITFDKKFKERKITLQGEAFFTVTKDDAKPFIVSFDHYYTQVLGTSFDIKAYGAEQPIVTVTEGKVAVGVTGASNYDVLTAHERLTIFPTAITKEIIPNTARIVAWQKGEIQFHQTKLTDVISELERWYHADLVIANPNANMPTFTAVIKPNTTLEEVLQILSMTNKISYRQADNKIIITAN
ncbi:FecR family protein [[Flexibacter] sp. ATCC 35208]|uniref:FecR family protein n=1 Tax=[Flexibacter] sp. ATCC 35208 TaxID=1936242 RepID=UPI00117FDB0E|nr:FecR family protein [[Flexibacter] sp. ATCC 35208]